MQHRTVFSVPKRLSWRTFAEGKGSRTGISASWLQGQGQAHARCAGLLLAIAVYCGVTCCVSGCLSASACAECCLKMQIPKRLGSGEVARRAADELHRSLPKAGKLLFIADAGFRTTVMLTAQLCIISRKALLCQAGR